MKVRFFMLSDVGYPPYTQAITTTQKMIAERPEGTAARPMAPVSSVTSTSTVGLPRLSKTSRAKISMMAVMIYRQAAFHFWLTIAAVARANVDGIRRVHGQLT